MIICTNWSFLLRGSKHWQLRQQCCFSMLYLCVMLHYFQHNMKPAWTDVFYLTLIYFILYFCYHKIITWFCSQKGWNHLKKFSSCEVNFDTQTYAFDQLLSVLTLLTLWGNGENQKVQDKQRYHILAVAHWSNFLIEEQHEWRLLPHVHFVSKKTNHNRV